MKKHRVVSIFLVSLIFLTSVFSLYGCYSRPDKFESNGVLSEQKVNEIARRFHITDIERIYDTTIGGTGAEEINQVPAGFKYGVMRVVVGKNDKGERVKLYIDRNNNINPEDTAFIIPQK